MAPINNCQLALALAAIPACVGLRLPHAISSNMVLQRTPHAPRLWGFGDPDEIVTAEIDSVSKSTTVDANGNWVLDLEVQEAGSGKTIELKSSAGEQVVRLSNVAFGDVYICSGQSNMEMVLSSAFDGDSAIADSVNYPDLRLYNVLGAASNTPHLDSDSKTGVQWSVSSPGALGSGPDDGFSAVCFFFGRDIYRQLGGKVPVGLVAGSWNAQPIEMFASEDAREDESCGGTKVRHRHGKHRQDIAFLAQPSWLLPSAPVSAAAGAPDDPSHSLRWTPSQYGPEEATVSLVAAFPGNVGRPRVKKVVPQPGELWNGMIFPFLRMRITGVVWYQGEANYENPIDYACRFPAMIADWRAKFQLPEMWFLFVQLSSDGKVVTPEIREAQLAGLKLGRTLAIPSFDLGEPKSPFTAIHSRRKAEVGRRLASAMLGSSYGSGQTSTGPVFKDYTFDRESLDIRIIFMKNTADGLHLDGTAGCSECCAMSPVEVRTSSGDKWRSTKAAMAEGLVLRARLDGPLSAGETVTGVRLSYEKYPQCAVYNGEGGPDNHRGLAAMPRLLNQEPSAANWQELAAAEAPSKKAAENVAATAAEKIATEQAVAEKVAAKKATDQTTVKQNAEKAAAVKAREEANAGAAAEKASAAKMAADGAAAKMNADKAVAKNAAEKEANERMAAEKAAAAKMAADEAAAKMKADQAAAKNAVEKEANERVAAEKAAAAKMAADEAAAKMNADKAAAKNAAEKEANERVAAEIAAAAKKAADEAAAKHHADQVAAAKAAEKEAERVAAEKAVAAKKTADQATAKQILETWAAASAREEANAIAAAEKASAAEKAADEAAAQMNTDKAAAKNAAEKEANERVAAEKAAAAKKTADEAAAKHHADQVAAAKAAEKEAAERVAAEKVVAAKKAGDEAVAKRNADRVAAVKAAEKVSSEKVAAEEAAAAKKVADEAAAKERADKAATARAATETGGAQVFHGRRPLVKSYAFDTETRLLRVAFVDGSTGGGLYLEGAPGCTKCCEESPLEVRVSPSNQWRETGTLEVHGDKELAAHVELEANASVTGVRVGWIDHAQCQVHVADEASAIFKGSLAQPFDWLQPPALIR